MTTPTDKQRVALFGLGLLGAGMAKSLLKAGFPLIIFNRTPEKAEPFVVDGARTAATPKEAAQQADILVSVVSDDAASRAVWLGEQGALAGVSPGKLVIEVSTLSLVWVKELAESARKLGAEFLDAPVTGSRVHAAAGELNFLVGGSAQSLERARPILNAMGRTVTHIGPQGSGCLMKLINNFVCGVQVASVAEAMALIERLGLNRDTATEVLGNGAPGSPLFKLMLGRMTERDYEPHFHLELMAKDLDYACREGEKVQLNLKMAAAARELFEQTKTSGYANKDFSAVVEQFRQ